MSKPTIHGPAYSTYTRTARLALEEKGVDYQLEQVDILKGEHQQPAYLALQPFAKVPAFTHDGLTLYETAAIARYVDEAFPGPRLQPGDVKRRARMAQIVAIIDSYAYGALIGKVVWQRVVTPLLGGKPDDQVVAEAMPLVAKSMAALEAAAYFSQTDEGRKALTSAPRLSRWWQAISARPSVVRTRPQLG